MLPGKLSQRSQNTIIHRSKSDAQMTRFIPFKTQWKAKGKRWVSLSHLRIGYKQGGSTILPKFLLVICPLLSWGSLPHQSLCRCIVMITRFEHELRDPAYRRCLEPTCSLCQSDSLPISLWSSNGYHVHLLERAQWVHNG